MHRIEALIEEIKKMNENLTILISNIPTKTPIIHKIPQAAKIIGVSPALLRHLCDQGVVPSGLTNNNPRNKHYVVDVDKARSVLIEGGYVKIKTTVPVKRGPKSTTSII